MGKDSPALYRLIYRIIWLISPKYTLYGTEKLPEEPGETEETEESPAENP